MGMAKDSDVAFPGLSWIEPVTIENQAEGSVSTSSRDSSCGCSMNDISMDGFGVDVCKSGVLQDGNAETVVSYSLLQHKALANFREG
jgi:hypothetical protein